jgi:hypothetical protein
MSVRGVAEWTRELLDRRDLTRASLTRRVRHPGLPPGVAGDPRCAILLWGWLVIGWLVGPGWAHAADQAATDPATDAWFEKYIRPVLVSKCLSCHGAEKQEANLRLDSLQGMRTGGDSGPALVPGLPEASLLIEAIRYESFEMPPARQLPAAEIARFQTWIARGASWPRHEQQLRQAGKPITDADRQWWSFQPVSPPQVPHLLADDWSRNAIDRFVLHRLRGQGMRPAPRADKVALVRRLYFDVLGLPPSPAEVDQFVQDNREDAWSRLVDRLLADPRYGENWARHWLDVVRYAESDGWNQDAYRPQIWRYRDYVVRSFNVDRPYADFVRQQLAGDELPGDDPDNLAATGLLRLGIYEYNQRDARSHWNDIVNEVTDVTADVFLGLGMACARCHDHKFDPLLRRDYFHLRAFFEPLVWRDDVRYATEQQLASYRRQLAVWEEATQEVRAQIDALIGPYHERKWKSTVGKFPLDIQACFHKPVEQRNSWEHQMAYLVERQFEEEGGGPLKTMSREDRQRYEALQQQLARFDGLRPQPPPRLMTVTDFPGPAAATVIPDDPRQEAIPPGLMTVLVTSGPPLEMSDLPGSTGRRTALARWITQPANPLAYRVIVNRIWQQHFGRGLVDTPNDFGRLGSRPSHPELFDWLTSRFVQWGGRVKQLHRLILNSATWQQSSFHPAASEYERRDPGEELLWRAPVRRLSAEQVRDAMLAAGNRLRLQLGGPSVEADVPRRGLYVKRLRNAPEPLLHALDAADGLKSVAQRNVTTTPTQALLMINGEFALDQARHLADTLLDQSHASTKELLRAAFRRTWGRQPSDSELAMASEFVERGARSGQGGGSDPNQLVDFCHVLLNSSEFLYVE